MVVNFSLEEIDKAAGLLLSAGKNRTVFALHGDMGAGKTTLVHAVCRHLNINDTVSSPTFSIINEYRNGTGEIIYHLDLYRLESREVDALGLEEAAEQGPLLVEWGERLPSSWRADALVLTFVPGEGDVRTIEADAAGERGGVSGNNSSFETLLAGAAAASACSLGAGAGAAGLGGEATVGAGRAGHGAGP